MVENHAGRYGSAGEHDAAKASRRFLGVVAGAGRGSGISEVKIACARPKLTAAAAIKGVIAASWAGALPSNLGGGGRLLHSRRGASGGTLA